MPPPANGPGATKSDHEVASITSAGNPPPPDPSPIRVVGIGASAGGVEAYSRLLKALPADTGLAYLLVPHLSPTHHSELAHLLARTTDMLVTEARDGEEMLPDHLYVVPPDRVMTVADGRLRLNPRSAREGQPTVIDACLTSLAEVWGSRAVGVVLSGTGSDGAAGLQAIKAHGGVTYAQDFASAAYDSMPRKAIEAGGVDFTLPPEGIARALAELAQPEATPAAPAAELASSGAEGPEESAQPELSAPEVPALERILELLQTATGADFRHYKRPSMTRRVRRRMAELGLSDLAAYVHLLQDDPAEVQTLFGAVLIHVTEFFREPAMFQVLQDTVIPALFANRLADAPIRVWVVGCASGEEVYSTAITFLEVEASLGREVPVRILASDLSEAAVNTARLGRYPAGISAEVSTERLQRFFVPVEGGFQVEKRLRDMCVFARQDLTRDPPFAQLDLVICRNLLIYLEPALQHRVLTVFHYSLKPGGYLALGAAETVAGMEQLFAPLDRKNRVYLRRAAPSRLDLDLRWSGQPRPSAPPMMPLPGLAPIRWSSAELQHAAAQALFTQYPTGSVIVNPDLEIRHFQGTTTPYLTQPSGGPTVHILRLAHPDLRLILGRLIRKAQKERREVRRQGIPIKVGSETHRVNVAVLPVPTDEAEREYYLVLFESAPHEKAGKAERAAGRTSGRGSAEDDSRVLELEQELVEVKDYLQAIIDQQDETHAELQAAYESSLSANEEFQSTNEELESAKEELQSVNEELTTLNEELHQRNAELGARTAEVTSLLEAIEMPILLLNPDLRLRAFNSKAAAELRLARTNVGRPITEIQSPLPLGQLHVLVDRALADQSIQEQEVQDRDGRWYALRLWPVLPVAGRDSAVVAALVDIGRLKQDLDRITEARSFSDAIVETVREPLVVLGDELQVITANRAFHAAFKTDPEAGGVVLWELGDREWDMPELRALLEEVHQTGRAFDGHEMTIESSRIGRCVFRINARRIARPGSGGRNILLALEDVTKQRDTERQVIEAGRMQAVGQLAGGIAHEINNQMTAVLGFGDMMVKAGHLTGEQEADLGRIVKAAGRAAEITRQLLAFSRRQMMEPVIVELNALVATSESILHRIIGPDIRLQISLGDTVGQVRVDQAQFEQVLVNLVLNARDAMPQGGRISIETSSVVVTESPPTVSWGAGIPLGAYARLIIRDTGVGMDQATLGRIFEPFFTTKPQGRGTGLGLASVYGTVKQSGGFLWVQSEPGRGTSFTIDLPQVLASVPAKVPRAAAPSPRGSETLLVAEDEEPVRTWIVRSLTHLGYAVLEARDGVEALRLIDERGDTVELVVSDVLMPAMSGATLRARLAVSRPELPVLLMSAYALEELLGRGVVERNVPVLQKPFDISELASKIRSILDTPAHSKPV